IGPLAAELAESAFELGHVASVAAGALWEENQRTAAVELGEERGQNFAPCERRHIEARNQNRMEDAGGEIRSQRRVRPVFTGCNRPRVDANRLRQRSPQDNEVEMAGVVGEVDARARLGQAVDPTDTGAADPLGGRRQESGAGMNSGSHAGPEAVRGSPASNS